MIHNTQFNQVLPALDVLVAEDGLANRVLARGLLTQDGHKVTLAEDGQRAVSRLLDAPYDVVLMDIDMPVMDGLAATRTIRQREELLGLHTPVIALTSHANRDECLAAGMDAFLSKPLDLHAFRQVVTVILQQRAA
jgi:two-component system sensor histidine kinase/response regulator